MELNFIENENQDWVAEFEATGDFNLHLERDQKGTIIILQKQNEEDEYAFSSEFPNYYKIFNYDFAALLYPKYIKVISDSKVIKGSVNFNEGGGSGSGSGESINWEYIDVSLVDGVRSTIKVLVLSFSYLSKSVSESNISIYPIYCQSTQGSDGIKNVTHVCINPNEMLYDNGMGLSFIDYLKLSDDNTGTTYVDDYSKLTRITKEEFYNLEA